MPLLALSTPLTRCSWQSVCKVTEYGGVLGAHWKLRECISIKCIAYRISWRSAQFLPIFHPHVFESHPHDVLVAGHSGNNTKSHPRTTGPWASKVGSDHRIRNLGGA